MTNRPANEKSAPSWIRRMICPRLTTGNLVRMLVLAVVVAVLCKTLLLPFFIHGKSMEPTYGERGFGFCYTLAYRDHPPARGDIVILAYAGHRKMLLKRVLAFAGETVEWRKGVCYVDGVPLDEPYVKLPREPWDLPPREVGPGKIYVMGDNRSVPADLHVGGVISASRIVGRPLW